MTADNESASYVSSSTAFVYAGSGFAANGTTGVGDVDAFQVNLTTGALGASAGQKPLGLGGYGGVLANNYIYAFGGGPTPSGTNKSGSICSGPGGGPGCGSPPTLDNSSWNSLGISIPSVYLPGSTLESAFIYLVGGATTTATSASTGTWLTIW